MPPPDDDERSPRVVVVGSRHVVSAGIETCLRRIRPRSEIIGHCASPAEFSAAYRTAVPGRVVVFDLPCDGDGPGLDALRRICDAGHRVVVSTCSVDDEVASAARRAGAVDCIAKHEPEHVLAAAIDAAREGLAPVTSRPESTSQSRHPRARPLLTHRERQILIAWFQTEHKNAVARRLHIEPTTVATHLQRIRAKYAAVGRPAPTKAALVARAIQDDILSVDDL